MLIEEKVLSQKETVQSVEKAVIFTAVDQLISSTQIEKALRILDEAIRWQNDDACYYQKKSQILLEEGYINNAIAELQKAHKLDRSNMEVILNIVEAYHRADQFDKGIQLIDECLNYDLFGLEIELLKQRGILNIIGTQHN